MTLKNDWANGDIFTPAAANDMANIVNAALHSVVAPTGVAATDAAALTAGLADSSLVRAELGTYVVTKSGVSVPANKALVVGEGSVIRTAAAALDSHTSGQSYILTLGDGSTFVGSIDGNRSNQNESAFNTAGGSNVAGITGISASGTSGSPLTGLHIDATVSNMADYVTNLNYVNDSYIRIRATDCGGPVAFYNCENLRVDIEVEDSDNDGWKIFPHAVDFINCTGISGRVVIRGHKGTGTTGAGTSLSNWFSGLTVTNGKDLQFDEIDVEAADLANQSKSVGVSIVGASGFNSSKTRIVGYSDVLLELGGVTDSTFSALNLDARYANADAGNPSSGSGINLYNNAYSSTLTSRTLEQTRNVKFMGGTVTRCRDSAISLLATSETAWHGIKVTGSLNGVYAKFGNQDVGSGPAPSTGVLANHRFIDCDFSFNERNGVRIHDGENITFVNCRANNNGQATLHGATRRGLGITTEESGFGTVTGTSKTGFQFHGCNADDTQGFTAYVFPDPNASTVIAVDKPERYGPGQTITLTGAGVAGADLLTRVNAVNRDELTLDDAITTFPTATLTGTIATSGTTVTGTGTTFNTDLIGRAYIKVGANYRRVAKVASDTSATLETAFSSNVTAGTALTIVRTSSAGATSQRYGYVLTADTLYPLIVNPKIPTGNVSGQIANLTVAATPLRYMGASTSSDPGILKLGVATGETAKVEASGPDTNHSLNLVSKGSGTVQINGVAAVYSGSALGTPASGTLTNCTGLPASSITGTLPVANGGTGAATLTGILKGSGTSAFSAATAGTDYTTPTGVEAISGKTSITSTGAVTGTNFVSTVSTGTAPLTVASTTQVTNLNASSVQAYVPSLTGTVAYTLSARDANANVSARGFLSAFTTTATAAGTTTLTIASNSIQEFTGSTTQTVVLPTTSVVAGATYTVINNSSGNVTVQSSGLNTIGAALTTGTSAQFIALVATPTTAANWHRR